MSHLPTIAKWFHLDGPPAAPGVEVNTSMLPGGGEIVLVTGPSGAGKSSLLRALRKQFSRRRRWIGIATTPLPRRPIVDCFPLAAPIEALELLSRVGLAEASLFALRPDQLSDGQRFRLRLALSLHSAAGNWKTPVVLWCDEFAAPLDEVTAAVVAQAVRRAISADSCRFGAIFATGREALIDALQPEVVVRCDFGKVSAERGRLNVDCGM